MNWSMRVSLDEDLTCSAFFSVFYVGSARCATTDLILVMFKRTLLLKVFVLNVDNERYDRNEFHD